jgi:hypothetical protein
MISLISVDYLSEYKLCTFGYKLHILKLTNSRVEKLEGSTPLIPEPAIGHDSELVSAICRHHNLRSL